ncbi:hypothetical protein TNCV_3578461 [Trichonephila clavipes]|nr:hypothetical protein TNCV_3578461 [Trichonephila clavipes]
MVARSQSSDFFLFLQLRLALKGNTFDDIPDINEGKAFAPHPKEGLLQSSQDMYSRSPEWCIIMRGDYFEGQ